VRQYGWLS